MSDLQEENRDLRLKLRNFIDEARANELKLSRLQAFELELLASTSLEEVIQRLLARPGHNFEIDQTALVLWDPDHEIEHFLLQLRPSLAELPGLTLIHDSRSWQAMLNEVPRALLGPYRQDFHCRFLGDNSLALATAALIPLQRNATKIGYLLLGSSDPKRYLAGQAIDFLHHFAATLTLCLENATNHERLKKIGLTDPLTAVNNRRFFDQRVDEEVARLDRSKAPLSCMFLDLDHFKQINDTYGHQVGDLVLRDVATTIKSQLRSNDVLARYGGEEFTVLLAETDHEEAQQTAERIRADVAARLFHYPGAPAFRATLSAGVVTLDGTVAVMDKELVGKSLLARADHALYEAKHSGRNRVVSAGTVGAAELRSSKPLNQLDQNQTA